MLNSPICSSSQWYIKVQVNQRNSRTCAKSAMAQTAEIMVETVTGKQKCYIDLKLFSLKITGMLQGSFTNANRCSTLEGVSPDVKLV